MIRLYRYVGYDRLPTIYGWAGLLLPISAIRIINGQCCASGSVPVR